MADDRDNSWDTPSNQQRGRDGNLEGGAEPQQVPQQTTTREVTDDEKLWALLSHVAYFFLSIIGAVLIFALDDDLVGQESPFVRHHAKQAMLWQIGSLLVGGITCGVGYLVMAIWPILAALAASRKEWYDYPVVSNFVDEI